MLPLELFRLRQFSGANAVTFVVYGALGGALFLLPVMLQVVVDYSPLDSGLALLPLTVIMLTFSARSGQLSARIGPRLQMTVGPVLVGAGLALLARATTPGSYWVQVFPAVMLFGAGLAVTVAPLTSTAMGAAPRRALGHRLGRQQHGRPCRRALRRGLLPAPGRPVRRCRPQAGRAGRGFPHWRSSSPAPPAPPVAWWPPGPLRNPPADRHAELLARDVVPLRRRRATPPRRPGPPAGHTG